VAGTLARGDYEGLRRSAAMAPLDRQQVVRLIEAYDELLAERDQLVSTLRPLTPAWAEVREVLNEMVKQLTADGSFA
jgi:hypothetical protein